METTRLIPEATSKVNILITVLSSADAAWPIHYFVNKNVINFFLKLEKLVKLVIDTGTEFQILGLGRVW